MDHFYVAAEEEWVTSFGWQKNGVEVFKYRFAPLDCMFQLFFLYFYFHS